MEITCINKTDYTLNDFNIELSATNSLKIVDKPGTMCVGPRETIYSRCIIKINSTESIIGSVFTVTINGESYDETLFEGRPFWENSSGVGLTVYHITEANEIVVDQKGNCPNIESIKLNIEGVDVPIILKS